MSRLNSLKSFFVNPISERVFFGLFFAISLFKIWALPAFITMDGPAHLYNASILNFFNDDPFYSGYLEKNHWYLPNFLSHWILQALLHVFQFLVAEKILVSLIVVLTALSFRKLISTISKDTPYYSFLVFPVIFTNLLQHGFYNFSLSFGLLNLQLLFTIQFLKPGKSYYLVLLFANSILLYYCHLLGFGISIIVCSAYLIAQNWSEKKLLFQKLTLFAIIHLPGILMARLFVLSVVVPIYNYDLDLYEKSMALITFGPGIVFDMKEELPYTILIVILIIVLSTLVFSKRRIEGKQFRVTDIFLLLSMLLIYLIFHSKNGDLGGMFTQRQLCICFYFLMLWLACNSPKGTIQILALFVVFFEFCCVASVQYKIAEAAQSYVADVINARPYIKEKSVVKTVPMSGRWFNRHISGYLGINREIMLLENYEASLGWFPISWNKKFLLDRDQGIEPNADYVFIYGNDSTLHTNLNTDLKRALDLEFHKIYESRDLFCRLFKRN